MTKRILKEKRVHLLRGRYCPEKLSEHKLAQAGATAGKNGFWWMHPLYSIPMAESACVWPRISNIFVVFPALKDRWLTSSALIMNHRCVLSFWQDAKIALSRHHHIDRCLSDTSWCWHTADHMLIPPRPMPPDLHEMISNLLSCQCARRFSELRVIISYVLIILGEQLTAEEQKTSGPEQNRRYTSHGDYYYSIS